ncbi:MAG: azurin [Pandoraea sp.]|nr:azurin [Pandoraea sp.]MDR3398223.1 azurin [Pandoraea sp.]
MELAMPAISSAQEAAPAVSQSASGPAGPAAGCELDVQGRPGKQFSPAQITIPASCKSFTVQLIHTGKKPKSAARHNWVLVRASDIDPVIADGLAVGPDQDWVKPGDPRVIARTPMIGGGERASVTFDVSRLSRGGSYVYFCSFPSHASMMRGTLSVE